MACPSIPVEGEEVIPESVDLHSTLPTQTAMKSSKFQYFNPRSSLEKKGLIPFRIVSGDNEFIDPYHTYILHCDENFRWSRKRNRQNKMGQEHTMLIQTF